MGVEGVIWNHFVVEYRVLCYVKIRVFGWGGGITSTPCPTHTHYQLVGVLHLAFLVYEIKTLKSADVLVIKYAKYYKLPRDPAPFQCEIFLKQILQQHNGNIHTC